MNSRQRMEATLSFKPTDKVAHFESMFELEKEAFNMSFPSQESWHSCPKEKKERHLHRCMEIYKRIIDEYQWDALALYNPWESVEAVKMGVEMFGSHLFIGGMCGHSVHSIESVTDWTQFAINLYENREKTHQEAQIMHERALRLIRSYGEVGADFVFIPNDIAFNAGPFIAPELMDEFIFPYLKEQVDEAKKCGLYVFLHTDGQIMPILDRITSMEAHCLQSIDPMAGVDIKEVKQKTYGKLALMGNVQCSLLQDGPDEAIRESSRYALQHASVSGGYIFSSSNTIFEGLPLKNYHLMLQELDSFNQNYKQNRGENL